MDNLQDYKDIILDHISADKPLLGICLGLHVLFEESEENPESEGFGIFKGNVKRFNLPSEYKIPHMGWNEININKSNINNTSILPDEPHYMYFVHSYYIDPKNKDIVTAYCDYGIKVPVAVGFKNTYALQFHPEKSGNEGLKILNRFVDQVE